jgi:hypothetical protein
MREGFVLTPSQLHLTAAQSVGAPLRAAALAAFRIWHDSHSVVRRT